MSAAAIGLLANLGMGIAGAAGAFNADAPHRSLKKEIRDMYGLGPYIQDQEGALRTGYTGQNLQNLGLSLSGQNGQPGLMDLLGQAGAGGNAALAGGGPGTYAALRGINPAYTNLLDSLTSTAQRGMDLGGRLSPDQIYNATLPIYKSFASRGLFTAPGNAMAAGLKLYGDSNALQQQRTSTASNIAQLLDQAYLTPVRNFWSGARPGNLLSGASGLMSKTGIPDWLSSYSNAVGSGNLQSDLQAMLVNTELEEAGRSQAMSMGFGGSSGGLMGMFGGGGKGGGFSNNSAGGFGTGGGGWG